MPRLCLMPAIYASYYARMHLRESKISKPSAAHTPRELRNF